MPKCFEDQIFCEWTKFLHFVNRCLKKCFHNGELFKPGYLGQLQHHSVDSELLIKFIEKMVLHLQGIESQVQKLKDGQMKTSHFHIIDLISESSLRLS